MRATTYLGDEVLAARPKSGRAILGCLCLLAGARLKRRALAAMMWDRVPRISGAHKFRQAFRELVVAFGPLAKRVDHRGARDIRLNTDCAGSMRWRSRRPPRRKIHFWGDLAHYATANCSKDG